MSVVPCAVCGRDSEGGFYGDIPLCFDCYVNRPDDVLVYEAMVYEANALRDIHTGTDAIERSHMTDEQWAAYVLWRDAQYYQGDDNGCNNPRDIRAALVA